MREKQFYIFVPSDLDLWPSDLKFASLITLVQRYVSITLEVSMAFLFRENRRHVAVGRTDGRGVTLNAAPWGGPHNNQVFQKKLRFSAVGSTSALQRLSSGQRRR